MTGGAEQRLGLIEILLALRDLQVGGVERGVEVVGDAAESAECVLEHLVAVDDQPEGLAHAHVGERLLVDAHAQRQPAAALVVEQHQP